MGPDVDNEFPWAVENIVCAQPGENDPNKLGTGRYHMEHDPDMGLFGHAPAQE